MAHHHGTRKQVPGSRSSSVGPPAPPAEIPDKLYFRIGEVARLCDVPAYVLRFWEGEFPQLKPNKGGTGQRLFRRRDVEMARRIKRLLYDEGYTIPGARQLLKSEAKSREPQLTLLGDEGSQTRSRDAHLRDLRRGLEDLLALLAGDPSRAPARETDLARRPAARPTKPERRAPAPAGDTLFEFPASPRILASETDDSAL